MIVKDIVLEDFCNYKEPSMFLLTTTCTWKCERECGKKMCQNSPLALQPSKEISNDYLINSYLNNPITKAVVIGGLEPLDSWPDTFKFIKDFRKQSEDTIVIYTGYYKEEVKDKLADLYGIKNIIIKWGRFKPDNQGRFDEVLGIKLASDNQFAEKIS